MRCRPCVTVAPGSASPPTWPRAGIDLPGLELVIHADLPSNSETLLHRSGRTGRAGKKGVSALIVTPAEYKKAQRLLAGREGRGRMGLPPRGPMTCRPRMTCAFWSTPR